VWWGGPDTLVIYSLKLVEQGGGSLTADIMFNDSLNAPTATHVITSPPTVNNGTAGTYVTSFNNAKVAPGNYIFMMSPTITTKPTYLSVTMSVYKIKP
jgi:hypothetical protein